MRIARLARTMAISASLAALLALGTVASVFACTTGGGFPR
jgi:hypothetical protein